MALHKPECAGILAGEVHVQEKIDGANSSIWLHDDGTIHCGSRNNDLTLKGNEFNGFLEYVRNHEGVQELLKDNPTHRLYGEWLVRHTIGYNESSYKHFYLFDVEIDNNVLNIEGVYDIAKNYNIKTPHYYGKFTDITMDEIKEMSSKSVLGEKGEGVVIKPVDFTNNFGDKVYAKYVTEKFKEDNGVTFGGNNKYSDTYHEMYYVNKFVTLERVRKVIQKIEATFVKDEYLDYKHIPRIMETVLHDVIAEEGYTIAKEMGKNGQPFHYGSFNRIVSKKAKSIFVEILTGDISIANMK